MSKIPFISVQDFDEKYPELLMMSDKFAREAIAWLFDWRCLMCKQKGREVNEIIPRSRYKDAVKDWRNRVFMCNRCHNAYHENGVTDEKIEEMKEQRKGYLMMIGRDSYV